MEASCVHLAGYDDQQCYLHADETSDLFDPRLVMASLEPLLPFPSYTTMPLAATAGHSPTTASSGSCSAAASPLMDDVAGGPASGLAAMQSPIMVWDELNDDDDDDDEEDPYSSSPFSTSSSSSSSPPPHHHHHNQQTPSHPTTTATEDTAHGAAGGAGGGGKAQCWEHGCAGRQFSTWSNLKRHQKERSGRTKKVLCPSCGGEFTRNTARDTHLAKGSCNRIRRYSNGRQRPSRVALMEMLMRSPEHAAAAAAAAVAAGAGDSGGGSGSAIR